MDSDVRIVAHDVQGYSSSVSKNPKTGFTITYTLIGDDSSQPDKIGRVGGNDDLVTVKGLTMTRLNSLTSRFLSGSRSLRSGRTMTMPRAKGQPVSTHHTPFVAMDLIHSK